MGQSGSVAGWSERSSQSDLRSEAGLVPESLNDLDISGPCFAAAAAAKSFQLCLTLCDPIDGSPPGSPIPGANGKEPTCQCRRQMRVRFFGQEDPLEEGMTTHSSILAWRIP